MKMAKKLLAVVLTGVMAVSMLTGCASISSRQVADELETMLHTANTKATVKAVDDDLANDAIKGAVKDHKFVSNTEDGVKAAIKAKLDTTKNNNKYVWATYFTTKDMKKADKAQKIAKTLITVSDQNATVNTAAAVNTSSVKVGDKTGNAIKAGDKYELSMKEFTIGTGKDAVDYVMVVVTCKAVEVPTTTTQK